MQRRWTRSKPAAIGNAPAPRRFAAPVRLMPIVWVASAVGIPARRHQRDLYTLDPVAPVVSARPSVQDHSRHSIVNLLVTLVAIPWSTR